MSRDVFQRVAIRWIFFENMFQKIDKVVREVRRILNVAADNFPENGVHILIICAHSVIVVERKAAANKDLKDYAAGPNIGFGTQVTLRWHSKNFRGDVMRGATLSAQGFLLAKHLSRHDQEGGEAKVGNFEGFVIIQQELLRFKIAVEDAAGMAVVETADELLEEESGVWLRHSAETLDFVEELAACDKIHDDENPGVRGEHSNQVKNVG